MKVGIYIDFYFYFYFYLGGGGTYQNLPLNSGNLDFFSSKYGELSCMMRLNSSVVAGTKWRAATRKASSTSLASLSIRLL